MRSRICMICLGLTMLAGSPAQPWAATFTPQIHAPAHFRIDFTRPGGLPGAPRDIAAARDFGADEFISQGTTPTLRHKRRPRNH